VRRILLIRHGQTAWSLAGRHTSTTDLDLTEVGQAQATGLRDVLAGEGYDEVRISPRLRAQHTATLAGLSGATDPRLAEWDYGSYEGITSAEIRAARPDWWLWRDGCPEGERPGDVAARVDDLLASLTGQSVALVAHGHVLRVLASRWLGLGPEAGAMLVLDPARLGVLGYDHGAPALLLWNADRL
jgi:broad specificity phosphatase PhoE